jgi:hypothetical protein
MPPPTASAESTRTLRNCVTDSRIPVPAARSSHHEAWLRGGRRISQCSCSPSRPQRRQIRAESTSCPSGRRGATPPRGQVLVELDLHPKVGAGLCGDSSSDADAAAYAIAARTPSAEALVARGGKGESRMRGRRLPHAWQCQGRAAAGGEVLGAAARAARESPESAPGRFESDETAKTSTLQWPFRESNPNTLSGRGF